MALDYGTAALCELAFPLLSAPAIGFRVALHRTEGRWLLHTSVLDVSPQVVRAPWSAYDYDDVAFIAGVVSGQDIAGWLDAESGFALRGARGREYAISVRPFHPTVLWRRLPGKTRYGLDMVAWPYTRYELMASNQSAPPPAGFLVADDAPFFPTFDDAVSELLYGATDRERRWSSQSQQQVMVVRVAHPEAWIDRVEISPSSLAVALRGTQLEGTRLTISGGPDLRFAKRPRRPGPIHCPLPEGLPEQPWVVLSRGTRWLDYRYLGQQFSPLGARVDGIVVASPDICTRIDEAIARGEGPAIEFKERFEERALRTVAAFANEGGRLVLIGVNDDAQPVGISGDVNREKDRVSAMTRDNVVPDPIVRLENCDKHGRHIIAVYVEKGLSPPYGVDPRNPRYYVRRGANTVPAKQSEVRGLGQVGALPPVQASS